MGEERPETETAVQTILGKMCMSADGNVDYPRNVNIQKMEGQRISGGSGEATMRLCYVTGEFLPVLATDVGRELTITESE